MRSLEFNEFATTFMKMNTVLSEAIKNDLYLHPHLNSVDFALEAYRLTYFIEVDLIEFSQMAL